MNETPQPDHGTPDRVVTLTDAVVAIAMTLLALDLRPAGLARSVSSHRLAHYLAENAGQYVAFAIAFGVIAQFWLAHHQLMVPVRRNSAGLIKATMPFLFGVTLVPVVTYMEGDYGNQLAATLFAAVVAYTSLSLALLHRVIDMQGLSTQTMSSHDRLRGRVRNVIGVAIPVVVLIGTVLIGGKAFYLFLLFLVSDKVCDLVVRLVGRRLRNRAAR